MTDHIYIDRRRRGFERRVQENRPQRRVFDRRSRTFFYERTIHLGDTNTFGSVYFARFFDFQGEAREEFLKYFMGQNLQTFLEQKIGIVTVAASCDYLAPLFVYDEVLIRLQVPIIKRTKFNLKFEILRKPNRVCAHAEQWIGFTSETGKPIPIPALVMEKLGPFLRSSS